MRTFRLSYVRLVCADFHSKNCMREIRTSTAKGKPMIAVLDPDSTAGALSLDEVKAELTAADDDYDYWGFTGDGGPNGKACIAALLVNEPIEWNRIGAFQDVTLRLIAEQILRVTFQEDAQNMSKTYLSGGPTGLELPFLAWGHVHTCRATVQLPCSNRPAHACCEQLSGAVPHR